jgi:hypothetical protein
MNHKPLFPTLLGLVLLCSGFPVVAQILPEAVVELKIPLAVKPTSRPMNVAYVPDYSRYFIADGGLAPMSDGYSAPMSKSQIHVYSAKGEYLQSANPGLDNRSLYFNPNTNRLESVTYNISSDAGFTPNSGIFAIKLDASGNIAGFPDEIIGHNPAFGNSSAMPSYDAGENCYYAKQGRGNKVLIVRAGNREPVGEILLDLQAAGVKFDDLSEYYAAFTGVPEEELALLDVDHKAILVFDLKGRFVGRSALPSALKLRANNHYSGLGYANGMFFVYHESEGEFGTYYGFRVLDQAK